MNILSFSVMDLAVVLVFGLPLFYLGIQLFPTVDRFLLIGLHWSRDPFGTVCLAGIVAVLASLTGF